MAKYRKKPVVIEAVQWTGENTEEIQALMSVGKRVHSVAKNTMCIKTLEGDMTASINDWIIKGIKGECYPCKPDIFEQTYDLVE